MIKRKKWVAPLLLIGLWFVGCKCQVETGNLTPISEKKSQKNSAEKKLGISNIVFCSESPAGYMDYKEQPDATYKAGETVWIYCNLDGVKYNLNPDGTKEVWITLNLRLKAPDGKVVLDQEVLNEHRNFEKEYSVEELFMRININTGQDMAEGKYTVELALADKLAGKEVTASSAFTLIH